MPSSDDRQPIKILARQSGGSMRRICVPKATRVRVLFLASLLIVCRLACSPASAHAQGISYHYDELGRLIALVSPGIGTAVYTYDVVGNLLSITRYAATAVLIVDFTPKQGPVGTTVTIVGVGFSATPGQNAVRFNGTQATVGAASTTQLTVTVPAGATTGTISVTAPGGSSTSATPFTVTGTSGAPTISNFAPAIGTAGTAVAVNGTNFEVRPTDNRLLFNVLQAPVATATSTVLSPTVPGGGTSGRLTVSTPNGQAQSTADFFIPPPGYTTAQVVFTGRLVLGGATLTPSFATAGKIALVVFDGTSSQQVSLGIGGGVVSTTTTIYNPNGTVLGSVGTDFNGGSLQVSSLPVTGTYTIMVLPGPNTGNAPLTLSQDLNLGAIQINGASVNVAIARQGQRARLTFSGTTGQRLTIGTVNATRQATYSVLNPDGSQLVSQVLSSGSLTVPPLPTTGTYTILMAPDHGIPMSVTVALSSEVSGTIVIGGAAVPVTIVEPWQRARLTFNATAGQRLDLGVTGSTLPSWRTTFLAPDGSTVMSQIGGNGNAALHTPPLTQTGTHTLLLEPLDPSTGTLTYTLSAEVSGTITPGGAAVPVSLTRVGQRARLTFSGTVNQRVSLSGTGVTTPSAIVSLLRADGSGFATFFTAFAGQTGFGGPVILPASETYGILVDPSSPGDLTLTLYDVPPDITGSISINASPQTVTFAGPGQRAFLTFPGTVGLSVTVRGSNSTVGCFNNIALTYAGGGTSWAPVCGASFTLGPVTLGATTTYTLLLDPDKANIGSIDIQVTNP
jgi:YD repeat-containing protein